MKPDLSPPRVGEPAPLFSIPLLQGGRADLAGYRGRRHVVLWFSRGFTCPYCRTSMTGIIDGYRCLVEADAEVIQVAPNLLESARAFFARDPVPYPFICDPDKRLYAVYGLGDRGALEATRHGIVSFARAFSTGDGAAQVRGAWLDVANRNFLRRLQHHTTTALEQGVFVVDMDGILRHRIIAGPLDGMPDGAALAGIVREHCSAPVRSA
jgi:peroxiredoxin